MLSLQDRPPPPWTMFAIVGITLLAPAMAGSTELWAMAVIMVLTGAILLINPPRRAVPWFPTVLFLGLIGLAGAGFLPAAWSSFPKWRLDLISLGADLPSTRSPQPWITLQWCCLLLMILCWSYYLISFPWGRRSRESALVWFAVGVLVLAAAVIASHVTQTRVPFWPNVPEFGFFPNRNQTSNLLGLGGIVIYAIGLHRLQEHRPTWWIWLCSLSVICWALILNYSRAGILLFFGGALAWHAWWVVQAKDRRGPLAALCALILLLALFLLNGGKTLQRFQQETPTSLLSADQNGRLPIFHDAVDLANQTPFLGAGLGNFRGLFSSARHHFVSTSEAVHPESDWLWSAVDLGWAGPTLVVLLIVWWLGGCFPFAIGTARPLRIAALICGIAFAIHGLFDVSAHRLGTLCPALFLASMALHPHPAADWRSSGFVSGLFRALGFILIVIAGSWFGSVIGESRMPTTLEIAQLENGIDRATRNNDYAQVLDLSDDGLRAAPLNWIFYFRRGLAEAALYRPRSDAVRDFTIARYLFPHWPDLYLSEGSIWLDLGEADLAFDVFREGLERLGPNAPILYANFYGLVKNDADLRDRWRELGAHDPRFVVNTLATADPVEFQLELDVLLTEDPDLQKLKEADLKRVFAIWLQQGDSLRLMEAMKAHPNWRQIGWQFMARAAANVQDYRQAYETAIQHVVPPTLPNLSAADIGPLSAQFQESRDIGRTGLALASAQINAEDFDGAFRTLEIAASAPHPLPAIYFLQAQLRARQANWPKAWQALTQYDPMDH